MKTHRTISALSIAIVITCLSPGAFAADTPPLKIPKLKPAEAKVSEAASIYKAIAALPEQALTMKDVNEVSPGNINKQIGFKWAGANYVVWITETKNSSSARICYYMDATGPAELVFMSDSNLQGKIYDATEFTEKTGKLPSILTLQGDYKIASLEGLNHTATIEAKDDAIKSWQKRYDHALADLAAFAQHAKLKSTASIK